MRTQARVARAEAGLLRAAAAGLVGCIALCSASAAFAEQSGGATSFTGVRARVGGSLGLGSGGFGFATAASARGGVQITSFLAMSLQLTRTGNSDFWDTNSDTWTGQALLVEYMVPGSMFAVGLGPSYLIGTVKHGCFSILNKCSPPPTSEDYRGFGLDGRLAYSFGANRPDLRAGFTLELGVHVSPHSGVAIAGIGFDVF